MFGLSSPNLELMSLSREQRRGNGEYILETEPSKQEVAKKIKISRALKKQKAMENP